jgi:hypothetical protein
MDTWNVGDFCTLPTAARPQRATEFSELFERQIAPPHWIDSHQVEFTLAGVAGVDDDLDDQVLDLITRESACCSFFDFLITQEPRQPALPSPLVLQVGVPANRQDLLEALTSLAVDAWNGLSDEH